MNSFNPKKKIELSYSDIINADSQNLWFANNVAFLVSIGIGITADFEAKLRKTQEDVFTVGKTNQILLLNKLTIKSYTDPNIKDMEIKQLNIINGNYKLALYAFVHEKADITLIDNPELKILGLAKSCYDNDVFKYIAQSIQTYGLIRDIKLKVEAPEHDDAIETEQEKNFRLSRQNKELIEKNLACINTRVERNPKRVVNRNLYSESRNNINLAITPVRKTRNLFPIKIREPEIEVDDIFDVKWF